MLAAFEAGLAESIATGSRELLRRRPGQPRRPARAKEMKNDHFFTADGAFGSHDQNGEEVDGGIMNGSTMTR
jgi:hypothetical protein